MFQVFDVMFLYHAASREPLVFEARRPVKHENVNYESDDSGAAGRFQRAGVFLNSCNQLVSYQTSLIHLCFNENLFLFSIFPQTEFRFCQTDGQIRSA
jgi:hypothetical protein